MEYKDNDGHISHVQSPLPHCAFSFAQATCWSSQSRALELPDFLFRRMHSSSKFWSSIWIFGLLLSGHANAEFVPVRLARTSSSIIARDLHSRAEILRPRYEIQLTYVDKNHSPARRERPYVIQVTTSHESRPYISLEDVDDMLSSISCSGSLDSPSTSILLSFNDHNDLVLARDQWDYPLGLTFITNHPSCNDGSSHGAYR